MVVFQMIPILTLLAYFLYLTYYYAAPMFWLRVLMLIAYKTFERRRGNCPGAAPGGGAGITLFRYDCLLCAAEAA